MIQTVGDLCRVDISCSRTQCKQIKHFSSSRVAKRRSNSAEHPVARAPEQTQRDQPGSACSNSALLHAHSSAALILDMPPTSLNQRRLRRSLEGGIPNRTHFPGIAHSAPYKINSYDARKLAHFSRIPSNPRPTSRHPYPFLPHRLPSPFPIPTPPPPPPPKTVNPDHPVEAH